jgi:hypothetical protein
MQPEGKAKVFLKSLLKPISYTLFSALKSRIQESVNNKSGGISPASVCWFFVLI